MEPQLSTKPKPSPSRTWLLRLALMLGVPALLLGLAEGVFRLAGYGHPTSFFVASPHHENGELIENAKFAWRFLPPTLARASQHLARLAPFSVGVSRAPAVHLPQRRLGP